MSYILELLNNNGKESFRRYLVDNNYALSFYAQVSLQLDNQVILDVSLELTEKGYE